jgi:hypothetical protein
MPRRLRIRQLSQLTDTEGAVIVAAPSRWTIPPQVHRRTGVSFDTVLVWFREWLTTSTHPNAVAMRADLPQLRGRDLACWCALDAPCHADLLLELANAPRDGMMFTAANKLKPGPSASAIAMRDTGISHPESSVRPRPGVIAHPR